MRIRLALAELRDEMTMFAGQLIALAMVLGPAIGLMALLLNVQHLPQNIQHALLALLGAAELAWLVCWAWDVHVLAGKLSRPKNLAHLKSAAFQVWQGRRDMNLLFPGNVPLEKLGVVRRHILARRLYAYKMAVSHNRLWERTLRLLPRRLALYIAINASTTKLFSIGRMQFIRRTGQFDGDAWMTHVASQVNAIYAH